MGYSPWSLKELDTTEGLTKQFSKQDSLIKTSPHGEHVAPRCSQQGLGLHRVPFLTAFKVLSTSVNCQTSCLLVVSRLWCVLIQK